MTNLQPFVDVVEALNRLQDETGHVALSITFNRSDNPIDWDVDTNRWIIPVEGS